jgi:hypothetical protein
MIVFLMGGRVPDRNPTNIAQGIHLERSFISVFFANYSPWAVGGVKILFSRNLSPAAQNISTEKSMRVYGTICLQGT